jgi:predicted transcriptional regulator
MMNVTIDLSDEQFRKLSVKAESMNLSPENLIVQLVHEFASDTTTDSFESARNYVLRKNKELYERLAR